jgi:hypothetical protein
LLLELSLLRAASLDVCWMDFYQGWTSWQLRDETVKRFEKMFADLVAMETELNWYLGIEFRFYLEVLLCVTKLQTNVLLFRIYIQF